jgi:FKBP-type peptidyl-prolyl cis-trans isomerase
LARRAMRNSRVCLPVCPVNQSLLEEVFRTVINNCRDPPINRSKAHHWYILNVQGTVLSCACTSCEHGSNVRRSLSRHRDNKNNNCYLYNIVRTESVKTMRSLSLLCLLACGATATAISISVVVTDGPSLVRDSNCFGNHAVEMGDNVAIHFNASYHESSPSGTPGQLITSSAELSEDGAPLEITVGPDDEAFEEKWVLSLLGYCYDDTLTLTVPHEYIHGGIFEAENIPADAILKLDVHIHDIFVEAGHEEEEEEAEEEENSEYDDEVEEEEEL